MTSPQHPRRRLWKWCRRSFRWLRITCLSLVLLLLLLLTWLRVAGLPDFVRHRLVAELGERGVEADFSSLRFHWFRGLVAHDLRIAWGGTNGPKVSIAEADVDLAPPPWHARRDLVRGLSVRRGTLQIPLLLTNEPLQTLEIDKLTADVRFLPGDAWEVRRLGAEVFGFNLELRAHLTNLAGLRRPGTPTDPAGAAHRIRLLRSIVEEFARWTAPTPPRLEIDFNFDGRRPETADGIAYLSADEVHTPHGDIHQLRVSARVPPSTRRETSDASAEPAAARSSVTFELAELQTPQGGATGISARLDVSGPPRPALPTHATWHGEIQHLFLRGLRIRGLSVTGTNDLLATPTGSRREDLLQLPVATHVTATARRVEAGNVQGAPVTAAPVTLTLDARHTCSTNLPTEFRCRLESGRVEGTPGSVASATIRADLHAAPAPVPAPPNLAAWTWLWPFAGTVDLDLTKVDAPGKLTVDAFGLGLDWQAPTLGIRQLTGGLYQGQVLAHGDLDVITRAARAEVTTTFDLHGIDALLGPRSRENFQRYQWQNPPRFDGTVSATLPPWNDPKPDWNALVKPTLRLDARFRVGAGGFKGVPFDSATSSLHFDGDNWRLPDLHTTRPEGEQDIVVDYNEDSREYRVDARGRVDPPILRPLIGDKTAEILDLFEFRSAVDATVSVWGPWSEGTKQSISGTLHATNLKFRGHDFDRLDAMVVYTNRFIVGSPVAIGRDKGELLAEGVGYDLDADRLWLTNVVNTIEPAVVAATISPDFPEKLRHYRFDTPPRVHASGTVRPRTPGSADIAFDIDGGPFHFWRFSADHIQTRLLWQGQNLTLTNIQAAFYQGWLGGDAEFDLSDPADGRYRFNATVRDARLEEMLREMTGGKTNVAQGVFDLDLNITSARTSDLWTWNGDGTANLRDGLLWDVPIFSFLSPVLNAVNPGLGNNRAKRADATFTVTNGVFHTRDMVIACPPAKLLYRGTIDFDQHVNAKVEGQMLSTMGGFGPLFGLVLRPLTKLLEFRVTGTLTKVEAEPLYIPKLLLLPLQPVRAILGIFGGGKAEDRPAAPTNAPPTLSPPP